MVLLASPGSDVCSVVSYSCCLHAQCCPAAAATPAAVEEDLRLIRLLEIAAGRTALHHTCCCDCREEEEKGNAMKQLENRTLDSKREMDIMAALDEMQSLKARHERVDTDAALAALQRSAMEDEAAGQDDQGAEDESVLRKMLEQVRVGKVSMQCMHASSMSHCTQDTGTAIRM